MRVLENFERNWNNIQHITDTPSVLAQGEYTRRHKQVDKTVSK